MLDFVMVVQVMVVHKYIVIAIVVVVVAVVVVAAVANLHSRVVAVAVADAVAVFFVHFASSSFSILIVQSTIYYHSCPWLNMSHKHVLFVYVDVNYPIY